MKKSVSKLPVLDCWSPAVQRVIEANVKKDSGICISYIEVTGLNAGLLPGLQL